MRPYSQFACTLLLAQITLTTCGVTLRAQDDKWQPPENWMKVAAAQFGHIEALVGRDGYLCWVESKLVPETARDRAQSFDRRMYRLRLSDGTVEQLYRQVTSGIIEPLLGPGGAVATKYNYPRQKLFLPGQPSVELPEMEAHHPKEFTKDGLLCHAQRYHGSGGYYDSSLALVPIAAGKAQVDATKRLLPWVVGELSPDGFYRWGVFRRDSRLIYGLPGPVRPATKNGRDKPGNLQITVWDEKEQAQAWQAEGILIAADEQYVYSRTESMLIRAQAEIALIRRPLSGHGEGSRLDVPHLGSILDLRPPRLLGLFGKKEEWAVGLVDLDTGERTDFGLAVHSALRDSGSGASAPGRPIYLRASGLPRSGLLVAWDAGHEGLYVAADDTIYEASAAGGKRVIERPNWEPLP